MHYLIQSEAIRVDNHKTAMSVEENTITPPSGARFMLLSFMFWITWGAFIGLFTYYGQASLGWDVALPSTLMGNVIGWSFWGLVTPLINWLRIRVRISRKTAIASIPMHAILAFSFGFIQQAYFGLFQSLIGHRFSSETFEQHIDFYLSPYRILQNGSVTSLVYWLVLGGGYAYGYYRESIEKNIRALNLEKELVSAKLTSLQYQLQPHFLFNTLNTVAALVSGDEKRRAISVISKLSGLLRFSLDSAKTHEVTLKSEMAMLDKYLDIISIRFGDRISIAKEIETDCLKALVPNMILQPLVENAVVHGIEKNSAGGIVSISASVQNAKLHLRVSDSGSDSLEANTDSLGTETGLANTRARLSALYGEEFEMGLASKDGNGMTVTLTIPYHVK